MIWTKANQKAVALTLRTHFELSYAFIAEIVETSPSSVKRWFQTDVLTKPGQVVREGKYKKTADGAATSKILDVIQKYENFVGSPVEEHRGMYVGCILNGAVLCAFEEDGAAFLLLVNADSKKFDIKRAADVFKPTKAENFASVETESSITITERGKPRTVTATNPAFRVVQKLLRKGKLADAHSSMKQVDSKSVAMFTEGRVSIDKDNNVFFDAEKIESALAKKICAMYTAGDDVCRSLAMFLERICNNPDKRVLNSIYAFIEANDIEIDSEGFIVAYKVVRSTYKDKHSNTMDNTPGNLVEMLRENVNSNPHETCSRGLHLCSLSYVPHFGSTSNGDRLVKCLVDPADFVSIPSDYNNAKARVCEYFVLEDVTEAYNSGKLSTR